MSNYIYQTFTDESFTSATQKDRALKISIAFVNSIFLRRDAISNTLHDRVQYAHSHNDEFNYKVFCYSSDYPNFNVEIVKNPDQIVRSLEFLKADIIIIEFGIFHDLFDVILCDTGAPKIVSYHNVTSSWLFEPGARRELSERSELQSWNLEFADFVVCNSKFTLDQAITYGVNPARAAVVPPSVPLLVRTDIQKSDAGSIELLFVGRLVPQKGILDLIKALRIIARTELPAWRLNVVGAIRFSDPDFIDKIHKEITDGELGELVCLLGELDEEELSTAFAEAHVLVLPSHHEGFGVPVIEALASKCVVVCSDAGSLKEVVGEFGYVFTCGDELDLARALIRVLTDLRPARGQPKIRVGKQAISLQQYSEKVETYVQQFLPSAALNTFYDIVRKLVTEKRSMEFPGK